MASFYEPDSFLLDPTSYDHNELPSSFLSFSSFADFAPSSPFSLPWDFAKKPASAPAPHSDASATSSPTAPEPFAIVESAFEPKTPAGDIGIFHTAGPSDPPSTSTSYRSSTSSDSWGDDPLTPGLSSRASTESFASTSTIHPQVYKQQYQPFAWDDSVLGGSSSFAQPVQLQAHRTTSNPSINPNSTRPRVPRPIASMPTLKEDDMSWFEGMDLASIGSTAQPVSNLETTETSLADEFDWAFADFGNLDLPVESTIFAAFNEEPSNPAIVSQQADQTWLPTPVSQETDVVPTYDYSSIANMPTFTIDPMTIMAPNAGMEEQPSRPSSAPGLNTEASTSGQMLSVPMPDTMTRSLSSDGFVPQRHAPPRDLFSYAPQQIPVGPPAPQPLYTTEPSPSYIHHPRAMPPTPTHSRRLSGNGLSVQIQQPLFSTYIPAANLPPTPQSATFGDFSSQQPQPVQMTRAGTQPLPTTRRLSTSENYGIPSSSKMPAHLVRAQAIVQMQEAKEETHRQEMRRLSASRRVNMQQASVMQPQWQQQQQQQQHQQQQQLPQQHHHLQHSHPHQQQLQQPQPQRQQHIMGWEGPSAQTASLPVLTTTPLVTIHPPPAQYATHAPPSTPHRVHPPPHPAPGSNARPIARLPVSPTKTRKVSASPAKRSPSGKKRQAAGAGGFSWGEATFINFTSDDADKLLTGVAPSGSQSKRKREEDALRTGGEFVLGGEEMGRERSKRSKSDE